jgi:hypothetical protein
MNGKQRLSLIYHHSEQLSLRLVPRYKSSNVEHLHEDITLSPLLAFGCLGT